MVARTIEIDSRLNGPPQTAQGGIAAGLLGSMIEGPVRVRLHRPPPLQQPLRVLATDQGLQALAGDDVVMTAGQTRLDLEPPEVDLEIAQDASAGPRRHAAPTCVVCGPDHPQSLGVFPGVVPGREVLATGWHAPAWTTDDQGVVRPEIVWGVLDCPGGWSLGRFNKGDPFFPALGTVAVDLRSPIAADERVVVLGWPLGSEGRKHYAGTAIVGLDGEIKAVARQTCIAVRPSWALGDG